MNGAYVPFEEIVISAAERTGKMNLRNKYPYIKQLVIDAEREINPYASLLVKKKMTYHVGNGNFDGKNIVRPKDFYKIDKVGSCEEQLCPDQYLINTDFIILCDRKPRKSVTFVYFGLACDGTGNPFILDGHKEAVLSYIEYMFYKPLINQGKGNANWAVRLEQNWHDRCMEARGEDVMKVIYSDLESATQYNSLGAYQISQMNEQDSCCSSLCFNVVYDDNSYMKKTIHYWQFSSPSETRTIEECSSDDFLSTANKTDLQEFGAGMIFNYMSIGKIGFAIDDVDPADSVEIFDMTNSSMNNSLQQYYDSENRRLILLSNNLITHSSIYFKIVYNAG